MSRLLRWCAGKRKIREPNQVAGAKRGGDEQRDKISRRGKKQIVGTIITRSPLISARREQALSRGVV